MSKRPSANDSAVDSAVDSGSSPKLPWPLGQSTPQLGAEARAQLWDRLATRLDEASPEPARQRRAGWRSSFPSGSLAYWTSARRRPHVLGVAALAGVLGLVLALIWPPTARGALYTQDGQPFHELRVAVGARGASVTLDGGVQLTASSGTVLTNLVASEHEVVLQLSNGAVELSIPPGGGRRWSIEAGIASVEVVGTVFKVARDAHGVNVSVSRGVVLVRSTYLAEQVARVEAGASLSVEANASAHIPAAPSSAAAAEQSIVPASPETTTSPTLAPRVPLRATADELLAQADSARAAGEWSRSESLLNRFLSDYPKDPRRGLVTFTLGVVETQAGHSATQTASTFRQALARASTASLRQDCYQRLIEALLATGDRAAARASFAQYEGEYPDGRYRERLRRLLQAESRP